MIAWLIGGATVFNADARIENDNVVIWANYGGGTFAGGTCRHLELPAASSQATRTRLFAFVVAAKATGRLMTIHYFPDDCTFMAFGADGW